MHFKNDTKTPGTDKSPLSSREYLWCLVAFVQAWEKVREKVNIYNLEKNGMPKNKACTVSEHSLQV